MTYFILLPHQINYNIRPWISDIVWPLVLPVQPMSVLSGRDKNVDNPTPT